ncbi:MAG: hypothetical protein AAF582_00085 [Pseudomonadota bacterium]
MNFIVEQIDASAWLVTWGAGSHVEFDCRGNATSSAVHPDDLPDRFLVQGILFKAMGRVRVWYGNRGQLTDPPLPGCAWLRFDFLANDLAKRVPPRLEGAA